jgi:hypothetical protein
MAILPSPPVPAVVAPGLPITGGLWNAQVGAATAWALGHPFAALRQLTAQSIPSGAWTAIAWDTVDTDAFAGWSSAHPTRWFAPVSGWYQVRGTVDFSTTATGTTFRSVAIQVSGTARMAKVQTLSIPNSDVALTTSATTSMLVDAGDYVELMAYQAFGANLTMVNNIDGAPRMTVRMVG